jgi:hypothetical protein
MALKAVVDKLEDVPEGAREHYKKGDDGKFRLDGEGFEFTENVQGLKSALEKERAAVKDLKAKDERFKDIDPDKAREALEELQKIQDKKLIDAGKIDDLLNERTTRMKDDFEKQIGDLRNENGTLKSSLNKVLIDDRLRAAAGKANVRTTAVDDVLLRGRAVFRLNENGVVTAYDGDKVIYGKDAATPISIEDWLGELSWKAPHLFEASAGGGASSGSGGGKPDATKKKRSEMTLLEKAKYIGEHGQEAYLKLPV